MSGSSSECLAECLDILNHEKGNIKNSGPLWCTEGPLSHVYPEG